MSIGCGAKWLKWMEASVFHTSMFVLVNGSPTSDFKVESGLWQVDPISPFVFVLEAEGLAFLINKATSIGELKASNTIIALST